MNIDVNLTNCSFETKVEPALPGGGFSLSLKEIGKHYDEILNQIRCACVAMDSNHNSLNIPYFTIHNVEHI